MAEAGFSDYESLWRWSVTDLTRFWSKVWDFCGIEGEKGGVVFAPGARMQDARFFPEARLNFAENLLRRRDQAPALICRAEGRPERIFTFRQMYDEVLRIRGGLKAAGVVAGDRVAGYLPNGPEAIIAMLATASLGAVWSSASPDFGVQGVLDRFGQIEPKVLFAVDGYQYNGKAIDCRSRVAEIMDRLPSLRRTIVVEGAGLDLSELNALPWQDVKPLEEGEGAFEKFPFSHPLFIMFSSGTTGVPKCIVHTAGGTLIQHMKEHRLHCDIKENDRVFYFTTCGWMMWNWLVGALASGASLLLYDGAPLYPDGYALFQFAEAHRCTLFGASAKYIDALRAAGVKLGKDYDLSSVRLMTSTGSPLSPEGFDYVYSHLLPNVQLASISGGTDIISCFVLGNPVQPVHRGEIQGPGLGMDVDVYDEDGRPLGQGKGELVCRAPFPSMPAGFWNDPEGVKYRAAYFDRFPGTWCHGDWCERTAHGGFVIHGRSDATLNPGGVRIGTAEIYRIVEQLPGIKESIAVGQEWEGDVRVVLFVVLKEGAALDAEAIRKALRAGASPRHVPAKIVAVADIPRTKSGKITELAVREVIHGRLVKNVEALANPEALALYKDLQDLRS